MKRDRNLTIKRSLCQAMLLKDQTSLWSEVKNINSIKSVSASEIDGFSSNKDIANCFAEKYKLLFSSVRSNEGLMLRLKSSINRSIESTCMDRDRSHVHMLSDEDIKQA